MHIIIPMWLVWIIMIIIVLIVIFLAIFGAITLWMFMKSDCHLGWFG